jgi:outer membrane protein TolC
MSPKSFDYKLRFASRCACVLTLTALLLASLLSVAESSAETAAPATAEKTSISFRDAIDLALQHSGIMGIAKVNEWRSFKAYQEVRNHYLPQLNVGSGLGYSYGFPLTLEGSAPSVVNFTSAQAIFSPQLREFLKAARIEWKAQPLDTQDKRAEVILDTALTYEQLNSVASKISTLKKAQGAAEKSQFITEQRLKEGVDSQLELTRSQLVAARIRLRIAEAESQQDILREHLSKLVGVAPADLAISGESIPAPPLILQDEDYSARAVANSPVVRLHEQKALAADARAKAEHKANLPTADLASQYAYLARFNNYDQYYLKYSANNLSVGLNLRFPFLDFVQRAKAQEADADAMLAHKQTELTKNQVAENALKLQRSIRQLEAARDVAELDYEVSRGEGDAIGARVQTGTANSRDQQNAELATDDKYAVYLDSEFELRRAQLQLLRISGELENWANPTR